MKRIKSLLKCLAIALAVVYGFKAIPMTYHMTVGELDGTGRHDLLVTVLEYADGNDTVVLHINSPGGFVYEGTVILNAMLHTRSHTVSINEGFALSGAALIATAADDVQAKTLSTYLFHRPYYTDRFGQKVLPDEGPAVMNVQVFMQVFIFPALTKEEQLNYTIGKDVTIYGPEFAKRLKLVRAK